MDLISCGYGCGVVLDLDKFEPEIRIEQSKNFDGYIEICYVKCPVCKEEVITDEVEYKYEEENKK